MKNIILIGMPGCGKSTFGKILAQRLHLTFVDADMYLEQKERKTIPELFAVSESCFRDAEERTIQELSQKENLVIATGGGVVKREINMTHLKKSGLILFIDRKPEEIVSDVEVGTRPLLAEGAQKVFDLYNERIELYKKSADAIVENTGSLDEVVEAMVKTLNQ